MSTTTDNITPRKEKNMKCLKCNKDMNYIGAIQNKPWLLLYHCPNCWGQWEVVSKDSEVIIPGISSL